MGVSALSSSCPLEISSNNGTDRGFLPRSWQYIPFSGGPRICLGQQFALTQIAYTLFRFFKTFRSIEARDSGPLLAQTNLTISFPYGCWISVRRA